MTAPLLLLLLIQEPLPGHFFPGAEAMGILCAVLLSLLILSTVLFLLSSSRRTRREEQRERKREKEKDELVSRYEKEKDLLQDRITELSAENSGLRFSISSQDKVLEDLRESYHKDLETERQRHLSELSSLQTTMSNLILTTGEELRRKNTDSMGELLSPLQDRFKEFSEAVRGHRQQNIETSSRLEQKILDLENMSISLGKEARNLTDALLGQSKVQGNFGEMILSDILTASGLQEGVHFRTQAVMTDEGGKEIKSEQGRRMIPDVQVFYPDGTVVVVDSKMSLSAYISYMNASSPEERKAYGAAHLQSVRRHIKELSAKDYASYIDKGKRKVEYNIMFVPVEGAFQLALSEDPTLWNEAKDKGVIIVSQMTLMIVLNLIQMSWRQHAQQEHIEKVYATAEGLLGAFEKWKESFEKVGSSLQRACDSYDDARKRLTSSRGNVLSRVETLRTLSQGAVPIKGETENALLPGELKAEGE